MSRVYVYIYTKTHLTLHEFVSALSGKQLSVYSVSVIASFRFSSYVIFLPDGRRQSAAYVI